MAFWDRIVEDKRVQLPVRPSASATTDSARKIFAPGNPAPALNIASEVSSGLPIAAGLAIGALVLATTVARFVYRAGAPLWLDEVWTGMIASQRSFSGFVRQCYLDVNAPLYYLVVWLWRPLGGLSNAGLRLPSAIFASLAPLIALAPTRRIPLSVRAIWAALLACWLPAFIFATEARCYALLLFLAVANTLSFAEILRSPRIGAVAVWAALSSLLILTHYFATPLVACQGLVFLIIWRGQALKAWPALAAFIPSFAEMAWHAAILRSFARATPMDSSSLRLQDMLDTVQFLLGGAPVIWILALCLLIGVLMLRLRGETTLSGRSIFEGDDRGPWIVAATSVGSVILCIAVYQICLAASWARPMLVMRYFTAAAPGVLLALALLVRRVAVLWAPAPLVVLTAQAAIAFAVLLGGAPKAQPLSFERAAEALMNADVTRVEFLWDDRGAIGHDKGGRSQDAFSQVGGFFFHRAGRPISSDNVSLSPGQDPNQVLLNRARNNGAAILWLYNTDVGTTAALKFPPRITQIDPHWRCRDFGTGAAHTLACVKGGAL
jgi:hypothetical protein